MMLFLFLHRNGGGRSLKKRSDSSNERQTDQESGMQALLPKGGRIHRA